MAATAPHQKLSLATQSAFTEYLHRTWKPGRTIETIVLESEEKLRAKGNLPACEFSSLEHRAIVRLEQLGISLGKNESASAARSAAPKPKPGAVAGAVAAGEECDPIRAAYVQAASEPDPFRRALLIREVTLSLPRSRPGGQREL